MRPWYSCRWIIFLKFQFVDPSIRLPWFISGLGRKVHSLLVNDGTLATVAYRIWLQSLSSAKYYQQLLMAIMPYSWLVSGPSTTLTHWNNRWPTSHYRGRSLICRPIEAKGCLMDEEQGIEARFEDWHYPVAVGKARIYIEWKSTHYLLLLFHFSSIEIFGILWRYSLAMKYSTYLLV